jgi:hypothetical protein
MSIKDLQLEPIARDMRRQAKRFIFRGRNDLTDQATIAACRRIAHGTVLIFTRDVGHHACGWWKNPEYERCYHLSMSAPPALIWTPDTPELNDDLELAWLKAFFKDKLNMLWFEGPYSPEGKAHNVKHWRLFCDPAWQPIIPRGEVYTREFTEAGWKSFSEVQAEREASRIIITA